MAGFPDIQEVDVFCFCPHGFEYCPRCTVDHRATNSHQVVDSFTEEEAELFEDAGGEYDREPLHISDRPKDKNWGKLILQRAKADQKQQKIRQRYSGPE